MSRTLRRLLAVAAMLTLPWAARAEPVQLDQVVMPGPDSNVIGVINECCAFVGQTYTAGLTGTLAAVSVDVVSDRAFPLTVAIRPTEGGVPTAAVLGQTTLRASSASFDELIAFSEDIEQLAGATFAIVVSYAGAPPPGAGHGVGHWVGRGDVYAGGFQMASVDGVDWSLVQYPQFDLHFRTFVAPVPEPATLGLFGAGIVCAAGRLVRRRRARTP